METITEQLTDEKIIKLIYFISVRTINLVSLPDILKHLCLITHDGEKPDFMLHQHLNEYKWGRCKLINLLQLYPFFLGNHATTGNLNADRSDRYPQFHYQVYKFTASPF